MLHWGGSQPNAEPKSKQQRHVQKSSAITHKWHATWGGGDPRLWRDGTLLFSRGGAASGIAPERPAPARRSTSSHLALKSVPASRVPSAGSARSHDMISLPHSPRQQPVATADVHLSRLGTPSGPSGASTPLRVNRADGVPATQSQREHFYERLQARDPTKPAAVETAELRYLDACELLRLPPRFLIGTTPMGEGLHELDLSHYGLSRGTPLPILASIPLLGERLPLVLNFSHNTLDATAYAALADVLASPALAGLDVSQNSICADGCTALARGLVRNRSLRALSVAGNRLGSALTHTLVGALAQHASLVSLDLSRNDIADGMLEATQAILLSIPTLTHLDLSWNRLRNAVRSAAAPLARENTSARKRMHAYVHK
jgi:hypothetical protein